jgi:cation:H+ antiporter
MFLLVKGADWFVDGASNIAKLLKIPSLIIGLTLVSMGTSAPEASVSIQAAISGSNDISIGNVVGSNIFNVLVVVGLSAFFAPMVIDKQVKVIDLPMVIGISVLLVLFSFVITPFVLDTIESIIMLTLFVVYIVLLVVRSCKKKGGCECQLDGELLKEEKNEETITFTPGPGVTAIVHEQSEEANSAVHGDAVEADAANSAIDTDEEMLISLWRMYKESNPEGTLDDFYKNVSTTNSEVQ